MKKTIEWMGVDLDFIFPITFFNFKNETIEEDGIETSDFLNWRLANSFHAKLCGAKAPPIMYISQRETCA